MSWPRPYPAAWANRLVTAQDHNSVTPGSAPGLNAMDGTHTAATIAGGWWRRPG